VRDVVSVGGGIAIAQAITLAFTPLLTRLFAPEAFGASAAYAAILNIILPLATLGYANAIVMPKTDEGAAAVARLSILSGLFLAPISLLLIFALKPLLASWTGLEDAPWVLYFIPVSIVVSAFLSVANQAAIREGLFKEKARAYVESTLLTNVAKAGAGFMWPTGLVLIVLTLLGKAINTVMQLVRVRRVGVLSPRNWWGWRGVREAATAHRDFALYRMPQSVIRAASVGIPVVVLTKLFGVGTAGQYSITVLLMSAPVMLLGDAVGEVFYPKITRTINERQQPANRLILRAIGFLLAIGVVPFGVIAMAGNVLLPWLLGESWQVAGKFSQWVSLWMLAMLASRPAVSAMPALKLQHILLCYEITVTAARVGALYAGMRFGGALMAIAAFALVNIASYVVLVTLVLKRSGHIESRPA
jgi:O-antigen/teichoic acid export membrane protein